MNTEEIKRAIEEALQIKKNTQAEIENLLKRYEHETGFLIKDIKFERPIGLTVYLEIGID